jgi:hypothetical protein
MGRACVRLSSGHPTAMLGLATVTYAGGYSMKRGLSPTQTGHVTRLGSAITVVKGLVGQIYR